MAGAEATLARVVEVERLCDILWKYIIEIALCMFTDVLKELRNCLTW